MITRALLRLGDFVFVTRPLILIPAWSFYILGARGGMFGSTWNGYSRAFLAGLLCLSAIMITAYLINQVFDQRTDRINNKGHFLTRGILSVRTVVLMALVFFLAASLSFRYTAAVQRPLLVAALVLSLVYSLPPLRLCARPFLDMLANAVGYGGLAFVIGWTAYSRDMTPAWMRAVPYLFLVGATFLHTTILDVDGDGTSGKITTSVKIGAGPSALLAVMLAAAGTGWAFAVSWRADRDITAPALLTISLIGFLIAYRRIRRVLVEGASGNAARETIDRTSSSAVQVATALVTVPAAIREPLYLALVAILVLLSRYYYRARFGIHYPGPAPAIADASESASARQSH